MAPRKKGYRVVGPYRHHRRWRIELVGPDGRRALESFSTEGEARLAAKAAWRKVPGRVSVASVVEKYEEHLVAKGNKARAIAETIRRVRSFHAGDLERSIGDVPHGTISDRYKAMSSELAADTHRNRLAEVKTFWRWVVMRGLATRSPAEAVEPIGRRNKGKPQLRRSEARELFLWASQDASANPEASLAVLMVLTLGLRASELLERRVRDVDVGEDSVLLWIDMGKTRAAARVLEVPEPALSMLRDWIADRPGEQYVFASKDSRTGHRDLSWLRKVLRSLCVRAKVPVVCPHGLRGTRATLAVEAGLSAHIIARELGHESFVTTRKHYLAEGVEEKASTKAFMRVIEGGREKSGGVS